MWRRVIVPLHLLNGHRCSSTFTKVEEHLLVKLTSMRLDLTGILLWRMRGMPRESQNRTKEGGYLPDPSLPFLSRTRLRRLLRELRVRRQSEQLQLPKGSSFKRRGRST